MYMKYPNIKQIIIAICLIIIIYILTFYNRCNKRENFDNNTDNIPFVIICWNNPTFVENFINQIKKYGRKIIILNNNSEYEKVYEYFDKVKKELGDQIEIRNLDKNYGHAVYHILKDTLPDIYILSDPDLELNANMPDNFVETLYNFSNKYQIYKVGLALDISEKDKLLDCQSYTSGKSIYDWEMQFWNEKLDEPGYELYRASIDTTLCLINKKYFKDNTYDGIRIAGNYTAKHLPWYKDYIKTHIPKEEVDVWRKNNKSSSILFSCLNE